MSSNGFPTQELRGGVVITGGASGIGRATGLRCAHAGASVALLDTNGAGAEAVAEQALAAGAPAARARLRRCPQFAASSPARASTAPG
jgi:NAD(P)-dependent dehydrogenase (short-subunit alcohol dehydrogenase family)